MPTLLIVFHCSLNTLLILNLPKIKDYPWQSIFKEFLQNADDAGAQRFCVYVDYRDEGKGSKKSLLTEEMDHWQGPAVWIYNDKEFGEDDFKGLIKLGLGSKSSNATKIGRFGLGFNSAYHLTDRKFIATRFLYC